MSYTASAESFRVTFAVTHDGTKLTHNNGIQLKLFPFNTMQQSKSPAVEDLSPLLGDYLTLIQGIETEDITVDTLVDRLLREPELEIESGREDLFREVVCQLFFEDGKMRASNLKLQEYVLCGEPAKERIAEYLADVLGENRDHLHSYLKTAIHALDAQSNAFERLVLSKLAAKPSEGSGELQFYRVTNALASVFEQDFQYVLTLKSQTRDYLLMLLEFYYFSYTAQSCLQLNQFIDGDPEKIYRIYFRLDWEKISQSRQCYTNGWKRLEPVLNEMFAHVITLEILNQIEESDQFDYVKLGRIADQSVELDKQIAGQIQQLTDMYRSAINCPAMQELTRTTSQRGKTADEIRFLFKSVLTQFKETSRIRRYSSYAEKFTNFCKKKFLKHRGRSGYMLNITEEMLIFLTKICVKDQELMRLNDVFHEFEQRGVFLDQISKDQVARYFEKLNLIEKKSDSGDAKYVKRIL